MTLDNRTSRLEGKFMSFAYTVFALARTKDIKAVGPSPTVGRWREDCDGGTTRGPRVIMTSMQVTRRCQAEARVKVWAAAEEESDEDDEEGKRNVSCSRAGVGSAWRLHHKDGSSRAGGLRKRGAFVVRPRVTS